MDVDLRKLLDECSNSGSRAQIIESMIVCKKLVKTLEVYHGHIKNQEEVCTEESLRNILKLKVRFIIV